MTGFNSKRQAAQAKLPDDDDTQVYEDSDTLTIVYQRGFADGKRAAQRKPLTDEQIATVYWGATGQSLSPQDKVLVHKFARAIEQAHNIKDAL
jgi:hypothetical protein